MRHRFTKLLAIAVLLAAANADVGAVDARLRLLEGGLDAAAGARVEVAGIGLRDLGVPDSAMTSGAAATDARTGAGRLQGDLLPSPVTSLDLRIRRTLPLRWQAEVAADRRFAPPRVRASCETPGGEPGALSAADGSGHQLAARVDAGAPRVVARLDGGELIEGELSLEFDLRDVRVAGRYEGRIVVQLEYL